jgi:hypothetical protein
MKGVTEENGGGEGSEGGDRVISLFTITAHDTIRYDTIRCDII